jgi:hypothetical protein
MWSPSARRRCLTRRRAVISIRLTPMIARAGEYRRVPVATMALMGTQIPFLSGGATEAARGSAPVPATNLQSRRHAVRRPVPGRSMRAAPAVIFLNVGAIRGAIASTGLRRLPAPDGADPADHDGRRVGTLHLRARRGRICRDAHGGEVTGASRSRSSFSACAMRGEVGSNQLPYVTFVPGEPEEPATAHCRAGKSVLEEMSWRAWTHRHPELGLVLCGGAWLVLLRAAIVNSGDLPGARACRCLMGLR